MRIAALPGSLRALPAAIGLLLGLAACGPGDDRPDTLRARPASVVVDACALEPAQEAALGSDAARHVLDEVILLCLSVREGGVTPMDDDARAALSAQNRALQRLGYKVRVGVIGRNDVGIELEPQRFASLIQDTTKRGLITATLAEFAKDADGIELALPPLPASAQAALTVWAGELRTALPAGRTLGVFAPPSITDPSDVPGGDAVDLRALAPLLSSVRLMTLDLHCCDDTPGPTTAIDWIDEVVTHAQPKLGSVPFSVSLPLYGVHFGAAGPRAVTYLEAVGLASQHRMQILRDGSGSLHYAYAEDASGGDSDPSPATSAVWFDDASSILRLQGQLDGTLPGVGVLYYGLGGEDPTLWSALQERLP